MTQKSFLLGGAALFLGLGALAVGASAADPVSGAVAPAKIADTAEHLPTATPIKHLVIIFNENVSYDHYFATYPNATNPAGEPAFHGKPNTPPSNTLAAANLLKNNPNFTNTANGADAAEPFRLDRSQAATADQNHAYTAEQMAADGGKADLFPKFTGKGSPGGPGSFGTKGQVMGYYDGNTVTALWNYAQNFAMSDNAYTDTYGPSTPGALEVVAGQTNGMTITNLTKKPSTVAASTYYVQDGAGNYTMINDTDPTGDVCSAAKDQAQLQGKNIGDLLNAAKISWGGFMGGFELEAKNADGSTGCGRATYSDTVHAKVVDYIPHHNWFQYYASTANLQHLRPLDVATIGYSASHDGKADPANHEYDLTDFYKAVAAGNLPAVSYLKLPAYQDGHAGYSDPLDEQAGTVAVIDFLEKQPSWKDTAVIVTWDDSDGWYDHGYVKPTSTSADSDADQLNGPGKCGDGTQPVGLAGKPVNGRCGPGTRIPFLVVSPWAKRNAISHTLITQASVVRFIEDNWLKGEKLGQGSFDATTGSIMDLFDFQHGGHAPKLFLNAATGEVVGDGK
jgi:phospholipase C